MMNTYTILDIETTGLSKRRHNITEIAAIKLKNNQIIDEFQTLINPLQRIPRFITSLTGITNEMVKYSPPINKIIPHFEDFLGKSTIVAHNATFDYGFLSYNLEAHHDRSLINEKLCTKKLANRILPELPSKKLGSICEHFNIINEASHRAMGDVKATVEVFSQFCKILKKKGIKSPEEILRFENMPVQKCIKLIS